MAEQGYRHLFASIPGDGAPGFQTAAAATGLSDEILRALEKRVGRFPLRGRAGERSRQVLRYGPEGKFTLLTTFTLLGTGPDGRPGNYLAESLLVPNIWLAGFGWDFAAAFAAVDWWGPEALELDTKPPHDLPLDELPEPQRGDLSRLAVLGAVGGQLERLLLGLVQAVQGRERLMVVEADAARPPALDELVALLPLAVPPVCRRQPATAGDLALTLRTRGPAQGMPEVAVAGVAAVDRSDAGGEGVLVVDLGEQFPVEDIVDVGAYEYVDWVAKAIRGERWDELDRLYKAADAVGDGQNFQRFRDLLRTLEAPATRRGEAREARAGKSAASAPAAVESRAADRVEAEQEPLPSPGGPKAAASKPPALGHRRATGATARATATPTAAAPPPVAETAAAETSPFDEYQHATAKERTSQKAAATAHDGYRAEIAELTAALRQENDRARDELVKVLRTEHDRATGALAAELEGWQPELQKKLDAERTRLLKEIERAGLAAQEQLLTGARDFLDAIREGERVVGDRDRQVALRQEALAAPEGEAPRRRGVVAYLRKDPRRQRWAAVAAAAVLAPLLVFGGWTARGFFGDDEERNGGDGEVTEAQLLEPLRQGPVAAALLARAATNRRLADHAAAAAAAILVDEVRPGDPARCVLLQAVIRRDAKAQVGQGFAVDGDCQEGTWNALGRAIADDDCCGGLPGGPSPSRRAACYLAAELDVLAEERCDGRDPWDGAHDWSAEEAGRFLGLLREAREAATPEARRLLPPTEALDVRSDVALDRVRTLTPSAAEARALLDLARQLAGGTDAPNEDVAAVLDELTGAGPPGAATETGTTAGDRGSGGP